MVQWNNRDSVRAPRSVIHHQNESDSQVPTAPRYTSNTPVQVPSGMILSPDCPGRLVHRDHGAKSKVKSEFKKCSRQTEFMALPFSGQTRPPPEFFACAREETTLFLQIHLGVTCPIPCRKYMLKACYVPVLGSELLSFRSYFPTFPLLKPPSYRPVLY